jgi:hypothetical protein
MTSRSSETPRGMTIPFHKTETWVHAEAQPLSLATDSKLLRYPASLGVVPSESGECVPRLKFWQGDSTICAFSL